MWHHHAQRYCGIVKFIIKNYCSLTLNSKIICVLQSVINHGIIFNRSVDDLTSLNLWGRPQNLRGLYELVYSYYRRIIGNRMGCWT